MAQWFFKCPAYHLFLNRARGDLHCYGMNSRWGWIYREGSAFYLGSTWEACTILCDSTEIDVTSDQRTPAKLKTLRTARSCFSLSRYASLASCETRSVQCLRASTGKTAVGWWLRFDCVDDLLSQFSILIIDTITIPADKRFRGGSNWLRRGGR